MGEAQQINAMWRDAVALGCSDNDLWGVVDLAWGGRFRESNLAANVHSTSGYTTCFGLPLDIRRGDGTDPRLEETTRTTWHRNHNQSWIETPSVFIDSSPYLLATVS